MSVCVFVLSIGSFIYLFNTNKGYLHSKHFATARRDREIGLFITEIDISDGVQYACQVILPVVQV